MRPGEPKARKTGVTDPGCKKAFSVAGLSEAGRAEGSLNKTGITDSGCKKASSVSGLSEAGRAEGSQDRGH